MHRSVRYHYSNYEQFYAYLYLYYTTCSDICNNVHKIIQQVRPVHTMQRQHSSPVYRPLFVN